MLTQNAVRALRLIESGARLTEHGNVLLSREADQLARAGLIKQAPHRWIAYALTAGGAEALRAPAI